MEVVLSREIRFNVLLPFSAEICYWASYTIHVKAASVHTFNSKLFLLVLALIFPQMRRQNPSTMRSNRPHLIATVIVSLFFFACTREIEEFKTASLSEYAPVQVGKYITYRLDSTVFTSFGANTEIHSYQEKHVVDAEITDAGGRKAYRILRFIRDTVGLQSWSAAGTYSITLADSVLEVNENNLRILKLVRPIVEYKTWRGNRYLPENAFGPLYTFNNDFGMDLWDYTYSDIDASLTIKGKTYNNVVTVDAIDETFNASAANTTVVNPSAIAYVNYLQDNYAKGIGLVYQQFIMWEYQPPNGSNTTGSKTGFGVKRSIIDHN